MRVKKRGFTFHCFHKDLFLFAWVLLVKQDSMKNAAKGPWWSKKKKVKNINTQAEIHWLYHIRLANYNDIYIYTYNDINIYTHTFTMIFLKCPYYGFLKITFHAVCNSSKWMNEWMNENILQSFKSESAQSIKLLSLKRKSWLWIIETSRF